jgi:hypothetical protein
MTHVALLLGSRFLLLQCFSFSFPLLGLLLFYSAFSSFSTFCCIRHGTKYKNKNKTTQHNTTKQNQNGAPRTRRMLRPRQSKPTPPKKAKAKPRTIPPKKAKAKSARAKTTMTEMKKAGRHPDGDSCLDHFGDLCKYRANHGMARQRSLELTMTRTSH